MEIHTQGDDILSVLQKNLHAACKVFVPPVSSCGSSLLKVMLIYWIKNQASRIIFTNHNFTMIFWLKMNHKIQKSYMNTCVPLRGMDF